MGFTIYCERSSRRKSVNENFIFKHLQTVKRERKEINSYSREHLAHEAEV